MASHAAVRYDPAPAARRRYDAAGVADHRQHSASAGRLPRAQEPGGGCQSDTGATHGRHPGARGRQVAFPAPSQRETGVEEIGHLVGSLESLVRGYGVAAVTVILALEALGAPLPGETLLIFSAVLAGRGDMSLPALLISAWAGSVLGDNIGYAIGRRLGRTAVMRYGARIGLTGPRFEAVERVFARYGAATVVFARFVNILRQLNGIVAGTLGMEWRRFLVFNALGAALWVMLWVLGAFFLSEHIATITRLAHRLGMVAGTMVAVALVVSVVFLWHRRRHASRVPPQ